MLNNRRLRRNTFALIYACGRSHVFKKTRFCETNGIL